MITRLSSDFGQSNNSHCPDRVSRPHRRGLCVTPRYDAQDERLGCATDLFSRGARSAVLYLDVTPHNVHACTRIVPYGAPTYTCVAVPGWSEHHRHMSATQSALESNRQKRAGAVVMFVLESGRQLESARYGTTPTTTGGKNYHHCRQRPDHLLQTKKQTKKNPAHPSPAPQNCPPPERGRVAGPNATLAYY